VSCCAAPILTFVEKGEALVSRKLLTPYAGADHIGVTAAVSAKTSNPRYGRRPCRKKPNSFSIVFCGDSTMSSISHISYFLRLESILTRQTQTSKGPRARTAAAWLKTSYSN
jgi:hypothetical protein